MQRNLLVQFLGGGEEEIFLRYPTFYTFSQKQRAISAFFMCEIQQKCGGFLECFEIRQALL